MRLDRWFVRRSRYNASEHGLDVASRTITSLNETTERLNLEVNRLYGENDALEDDLTQARDDVSRMTAQLIDQATEPITQEEHDKLVSSRCLYCGGAHITTCPRLKRIRFRGDGQTPLEVEFFESFDFPADTIVWIEEHPILDIITP
jgi:hypothetical protein